MNLPMQNYCRDHRNQNPTRKLAARTFIQSQYLKALAASLRVGFGDKWKRGLKVRLHAAICRPRFVFWRMRNAADATIRHLYVQVVM